MSHPPFTPLFLSHFLPNLERLCISNFLIFFSLWTKWWKTHNFHSIFLHLLSFNPPFNPTKHVLSSSGWWDQENFTWSMHIWGYLIRPFHTIIYFFFHAYIPSICVGQNIYIFGSNYNSKKPWFDLSCTSWI